MSNKITICGKEVTVPVNSNFTQAQWQGIADEMQQLDTESLRTLQAWLMTLRGGAQDAQG